jgi:hypothetical protein
MVFLPAAVFPLGSRICQEGFAYGNYGYVGVSPVAAEDAEDRRAHDTLPRLPV